MGLVSGEVSWEDLHGGEQGNLRQRMGTSGGILMTSDTWIGGSDMMRNATILPRGS